MISRRASINHGELNCPICLENTRYTVKTACEHIFCAECLIRSWESSRPNQIYTCPMCRTPIRELQKIFKPSEIEAKDLFETYTHKLDKFIESQSNLSNTSTLPNNSGYLPNLVRDSSSLSLNIIRVLALGLSVAYFYLSKS